MAKTDAITVLDDVMFAIGQTVYYNSAYPN